MFGGDLFEDRRSVDGYYGDAAGAVLLTVLSESKVYYGCQRGHFGDTLTARVNEHYTLSTWIDANTEACFKGARDRAEAGDGLIELLVGLIEGGFVDDRIEG